MFSNGTFYVARTIALKTFVFAYKALECSRTGPSTVYKYCGRLGSGLTRNNSTSTDKNQIERSEVIQLGKVTIEPLSPYQSLDQ